MNRRVGGHRVQERNIVNTSGQMRKQVADPFPAFTILLEIPAGLHDPSLILMTSPAKCFDFDGLIVTTLHRWLVIERVNMAGAAIHKQKDHVFRFGGEVGVLGSQRILMSR